MRRKWRISVLGLLSGVFILACTGGELLNLSTYVVRNGTTGLIVLTMSILGALIVGSVLFAFRPKVSLTDRQLVVRNPLRTHRLDLLDIVHVVAGYGGVVITTRSGDEVVAWAVQKSNLASWLGRRTRADDVVEAIRAAVDRRLCEEPQEPRDKVVHKRTTRKRTQQTHRGRVLYPRAAHERLRGERRSPQSE